MAPPQYVNDSGSGRLFADRLDFQFAGDEGAHRGRFCADTYRAVLGSAVSARWVAWRAGGLTLLAMGAALLAVAVGSLILAGGGVIFFPLALPPLTAGYMVLRATPGARSVGFLVAALYGWLTWSWFAAYPLRGLTPGPGQPDPRHIDMTAAVVAGIFMTAAVLILVGRARREASDR